MVKVFFRITVSLCLLTAVACGARTGQLQKTEHQDNGVPQTSAQSGKPSENSVLVAEDLLKKTPTGNQVLTQIDGKNPYHKPIEIEEVASSELAKTFHFNGAGIRALQNRYEIVIDKNLSANAKAHAIASGLELLKQQIIEDEYLSKNDQPRRMMLEGRQAFENGEMASYSKEKPAEAQFLLKALFYMLSKAEIISLQLAREGLELESTEAAEMGIGRYINEKYLVPSGGGIDQDPQGLFNRILGLKAEQDSVSAFQTMMLSAR